MPSNKYIDLTLGASGSTYTAPANGWYTISSTDAGSYPKNIELINPASGLNSSAQTSSKAGFLRINIPVKKGDKVDCWYSNVSLEYFRFIYAEGSK